MIKKAYAKVNLFLNVKGERKDGFHDLEMINITVGLSDDVHLDITDSEVSCETSDKNLNGKNNLAYKVAIYLKKKFQVQQGVKIFIDKHIPVGGGLGGGSADAAATLEGLNELWNLKLSFEELMELAENFGSDTPYCLYKGPAVVRGVGFDIEPIEIDTSKFEINLYSPKVNVSTGNVFKNMTTSNKYNLSDAISCLKSDNYEEFIKGLRNDLEDTVFELYPEVKKRYDLLSKTYGTKGLFMSGSGSTLVRIVERK